MFLDQRRYRIPKEGAIPSLQLGQLLEVQSQVADAKAGYVESLANRERAKFELNRASGILVQSGCAGLEGPGTHNCLTVFTKHLETERRNRKEATQAACNIKAVSERPACSSCRSFLHSELNGECPEKTTFDYPDSADQCECDCKTATVGLPPVVESYAPAVERYAPAVEAQFITAPGYASSGKRYGPAQGQSQSYAHRGGAQSRPASMGRGHRNSVKQFTPTNMSWPNRDRTKLVAAAGSAAPTATQVAVAVAVARRLPRSNVAQPPTSNRFANQHSNTNPTRGGVAQVGYWEPPVASSSRSVRNHQEARQLNSIPETRKPQTPGSTNRSQWSWPER